MIDLVIRLCQSLVDWLVRASLFALKSRIKVACQRGKSHQLLFSKLSSVSHAPLELVFLDVWGLAPTSVGQNDYYVNFIDDFSKFTWIYLIHHKSEVFQKFHLFQAYVECPFNKKILAVQTDWGGEYYKLSSFFARIGISHIISCPHTHQQSGAAEQKHRHIDDGFLLACPRINSTKVRMRHLPLPHSLSTRPRHLS
jgi:hypothetical protein